MTCRVCGHGMARHVFTHRVLLRHDVGYYQCRRCGYLQTEKPFWLFEEDKKSINEKDTGIVSRNIYNAQRASVIIYFFFDPKGSFVDYGGGYGIFTKMMRDNGFEFYSHDPYTSNRFSPGYSFNTKIIKTIELITAFEVFEHLLSPLQEIERLSSMSTNILFSTHLLPTHRLPPESWWYFGFDHGQHVGFFRRDTLNYIANRLGLHYFQVAKDLHLFSLRKISPLALRLLSKLSCLGLSNYVKRCHCSKMEQVQNVFGLLAKKKRP